MEPARAPRLELIGITKRYPGVTANERIDVVVAPREIHGVLGENGAGKSTLMKIVYGAVRPDEGEVRWDGERVRIASPAAARQRGIAMVFQHFALFDALNVVENVWLGLDGRRSRVEVAERVAAVAREHELELPLDRVVHDLSVGERQRVEIVRALLMEPRLLILDEPTSVLAPAAIEHLFATLRRIADGGCSILYVSHKLDEVRALCQRCTVLRAGRVSGVVDPRAETNRRLAELMLGAAPPATAAGAASPGAIALEVRGLSVSSGERGQRSERTGLTRVNLAVRVGEIVGIAGISGNGQAELLDALSGEDGGTPPGTIRLFGADVSREPVRRRRARGLRTIPEERIGRGAVPGLSLTVTSS